MIVIFDLEGGVGHVAPVPVASEFVAKEALPVAITQEGLRWGATWDTGEVHLYALEGDGQVMALAGFQQELDRGIWQALARFRKAAWSSEGDQAAVVVCERPVAWPHSWSRDGLHVVHCASWDGGGGVQVRVYDRHDGLESAYRAIARSSYRTGTRAGWSPDGRWFTIGGRALVERDRGWSDWLLDRLAISIHAQQVDDRVRRGVSLGYSTRANVSQKFGDRVGRLINGSGDAGRRTGRR